LFLVSWTTPAQIKTQHRQQWERGRFLSALVEGKESFPYRVPLKKPGSAELASRFDEVREWIAALTRSRYRVEMKTVQHRVIGANQVPVAVWVDSLDQLAGILGVGEDLVRFREVLDLTRRQAPALLPWLARRPMRALQMAADWPAVLRLVRWMQGHPRPSIYHREIDLPGVHTKFLEIHKSVILELCELALPAAALHSDASTFEQKLGFRERPQRLRLRLLDSCPEFPSGLRDLTFSCQELDRHPISVKRLFVTENEVNFLAFPPSPHSLVVFGSGYEVHRLRQISWMQVLPVYYWGDIDTHGFNILNTLRAQHPNVTSLMMDHETLLQHRARWGTEPKQVRRDLANLTPAELSLYHDLLSDRLGPSLRLEQELIGYQWLLDSIAHLQG
jgi:hypothetical protein